MSRILHSSRDNGIHSDKQGMDVLRECNFIFVIKHAQSELLLTAVSSVHQDVIRVRKDRFARSNFREPHRGELLCRAADSWCMSFRLASAADNETEWKWLWANSLTGRRQVERQSERHQSPQPLIPYHPSPPSLSPRLRIIINCSVPARSAGASYTQDAIDALNCRSLTCLRCVVTRIAITSTDNDVLFLSRYPWPRRLAAAISVALLPGRLSLRRGARTLPARFHRLPWPRIRKLQSCCHGRRTLVRCRGSRQLRDSAVRTR